MARAKQNPIAHTQELESKELKHATSDRKIGREEILTKQLENN